MIEQAMYFALGFLVAGLFTLMFLPAFWRRALRLSMRRLQMLAPMSMEEVIAERDLLRADFAVRERRLEQEIESVKAMRAQDFADVGRHAARIAELDDKLKRAEASNRDMETRLLESKKASAAQTELLTATEKALHEMTDRAEKTVAQLRALEQAREALGREKETHSTRAAAHEATIAALQTQNAELSQALQQIREDVARLSGEAARAPTLGAELARVSEAFQAADTQRKEFRGELSAMRKSLQDLQARTKGEIEQLENSLRSARVEARAHLDKLETARADNIALRTAIDSLRAERAALLRAASGRGGAAQPADGEIEALRAAIVSFGDRILAAQESAEKDEAPAKQAL